MLNGLDLFSGIGGITEALMPWVRPIAYCEIDRFSQAVLLSRMDRGEIPIAPIWDNVISLGAAQLPPIDIVYGGFPCQDISIAGNGKGLEGERSGLFFEIARLAREIRPTFLFLENVPAIRTRGLGTVIEALASLGYDCRWTMLSAAEIGAPHKRERWFLLAYANSAKLREQPRRIGGSNREKEVIFRDDGDKEYLANTNSEGLEIGSPWQTTKQQTTFRKSWWELEPSMGRVVDGLPARRDRIKALGNAVVPQQAREAFRELMELK